MPAPTTGSAEPEADDATQGAPALADGEPALVARRRRGRLQKWSRLLHVYSSMVLLLLVLFFGATGITLNHPEWTFGFHPSTSTVSGPIPATAITDGKVDLLPLSEYVRRHDGVRGDIDTFGLNATSGYITYRGPGYAADLTVDVEASTYQVKVEEQGLIGVLNDLHKGRSTSALWGHVIDVSGALLVITALAGLVLQLALRRRRTSALVIAAIGGAIAMWVAVTTLA